MKLWEFKNGKYNGKEFYVSAITDIVSGNIVITTLDEMFSVTANLNSLERV